MGARPLLLSNLNFNLIVKSWPACVNTLIELSSETVNSLIETGLRAGAHNSHYESLSLSPSRGSFDVA